VAIHKYFISLIVVIIFNNSAFANNYSATMRHDDLSILADLHSWYWEFVNFVEENTKGRSLSTTCAKVKEVKGAILCNSYQRKVMNQMFARASIFTEGVFGREKGSLLATDDRLLSTRARKIRGHDLKKEDLEKFLIAVIKKCKENSNYCLNSAEKQIFKLLTPFINSNDPFVVITFASDGTASYDVIVGHEILHAQYFLEENYRESVNTFWKAMTNKEKKRIRKTLSDVYNKEDEFLMINEFQAYILQSTAYRGKLRKYVTKYRERFMQALQWKNIEPLQIILQD